MTASANLDSRDRTAGLPSPGGIAEPASQPDGLSPLLPGASTVRCPPPSCTPKQLNAFLAAQGDGSSRGTSSASSLDEPIASRRPFRGLAAPLFVDVGDLVLPIVPGASPFSSSKKRERTRQGVAASYAAATSGLAAVRALRRATDAGAPDSGAPSSS